jgi:hypothetical protein
MNTNPESPEQSLDANADPLTGEAGAHPVATGIGAAAVGAAGLAAATVVAGPVGIAAAMIGGAFIGGYVGKAAGELIDPTAEEAFWREQHPRQPYAQAAEHSDDYFAAYRVGYAGYALHGRDRSFEEAESDLRATYEQSGATLPWEQARAATHAAWDRVHRREAPHASAPPLED